MLCMNADSTTMVNYEDIDTNDKHYYIVDCREDEKSGCEYICFDLTRYSVLATYIEELFTLRRKHKALLKTDKDNYAKNFAIQFALKIDCNSIYGALAYSLSPLFCYELAVATTALGRKAITTARDYAIACDYKFLGADTDSIFI